LKESVRNTHPQSEKDASPSLATQYSWYPGEKLYGATLCPVREQWLRAYSVHYFVKISVFVACNIFDNFLILFESYHPLCLFVWNGGGHTRIPFVTFSLMQSPWERMRFSRISVKIEIPPLKLITRLGHKPQLLGSPRLPKFTNIKKPSLHTSNQETWRQIEVSNRYKYVLVTSRNHYCGTPEASVSHLTVSKRRVGGSITILAGGASPFGDRLFSRYTWHTERLFSRFLKNRSSLLKILGKVIGTVLSFSWAVST
jgi:hypothetical protein